MSGLLRHFISKLPDWKTIGLGVLLIHLFFPHVSLLKLTSTDNQMDSSIFAIIFIYAHRFFNKKKWVHDTKLIRFHLLLGFCGLYLCLLGASYQMFDAKSLIAFINLFIFSYLAQIWKNDREKLFRMACIVCFIGFSVGLVQYVVNSNTFVSLVRHIRTDASRGLTGLSSEPFFYGLHSLSIFFVVRILFVFLSKTKFTLAALIFSFVITTISIFMFSKSSLCILLFLTYLLLEVLFSKNLKLILSVSLGIVFFIPLAPFFLNLFKTSRIIYLLTVIPNTGFNIFKIDLSFKSRWQDIETSVRHFISQLPWAEGFGSGNWFGLNAYISQGLINPSLGWPITYKALSGFGNTVFELGWLGLLLMFVYLKLFYDCKQFNAKALALTLMFILLGSVSMSTPFLGFMLGIVLWDSRKSLSHETNVSHSSDRTVARKESNPSSNDFITSPA